MLRGITTYYNRIPKFFLHLVNFIPVLLTAIYLVLVSAIIFPLAVAVCIVVVPLLYVLWRAKNNMFSPTIVRILYPFELVGLTIVNAPQIVALVVNKTKKINRPSFGPVKLNTVKMNRSKGMILLLKAIAILGLAGIAGYLVVVAAVVVPLAMGLCIVIAPFCYLLCYIKEKKFVPLLHKIPAYFEQIGFNIVNSRKIMTNLMVGLKTFKWPMF